MRRRRYSDPAQLELPGILHGNRSTTKGPDQRSQLMKDSIFARVSFNNLALATAAAAVENISWMEPQKVTVTYYTSPGRDKVITKIDARRHNGPHPCPCAQMAQLGGPLIEARDEGATPSVLDIWVPNRDEKSNPH